MPFHSAENSNLHYHENLPVSSVWFASFLQSIGRCSMGKAAGLFRCRLDISRREYPQIPVADVSSKTNLITNKHAISHDEQSPLVHFHDCTDHGYVLLLSIPHENNTSLHSTNYGIETNDNIKTSFINVASIVNRRTNIRQWNSEAFLNFPTSQDGMFVMEKVPVDRSQIAETKWKWKFDWHDMTREEGLSRIGVKPDQRQCLLMAGEIKESCATITVYRLRTAPGIDLLSPAIFTKCSGTDDRFQYLCVQLNIIPYYYHREIRSELEMPTKTISANRLNHADLKRMMPQVHQPDVAMRSQKNTDCLSNLKMYFVLLRAFDVKTNVFDDIVSVLPKFKKMGINTVWLSPPQPQTAAGPPMFARNDHGYWPSHHGTVDPLLGGDVALTRLIQEAHWHGIEIAIDAVLNHFGYADRVIFNGHEVSTSDPNYFVIVPNTQSTYSRHEELNRKIEGTSNIAEILQYREELSQYPLFDLPTLRKDNHEVRTYLLNSYKRFVDMGVTTFRIDAAKHMPGEFLVYFSNQLNRYALTIRDRPIKLIWEVYITNSPSLSAFMRGTLRNLEDPNSTFFNDFPMREEFRRIEDPNYQFGWLASFVLHREQTRQRLDRLIPLVEDHDNGSPIHNPSIARIIYTLTEFFSRNSTFIYHGSEQAGIRVVDRPRINTINDLADIGLLVDRLGSRLSPYRIRKETQIFFHVTEEDLLVSEKRLPDERSLFLAVNKGTVPKVVELSLQDLYDGNQMSVEKILATGDSEADLDPRANKVRLTLSPRSFLTIEIYPRHCYI